MADPSNHLPTYWSWLFGRSAKRPGLLRFADRWLILHASLGVLLSWLVTISVKDAANTVLLPLSGVFIGLCFAWGGNAQALLQTEELEEISRHHPDGPETFPFFYQTAILVVIIALVAWGLAGLGVYARVEGVSWARRAIEFALYAWSSITLRECWHVVLGAQMKLIMRLQLREAQRNNKSK